MKEKNEVKLKLSQLAEKLEELKNEQQDILKSIVKDDYLQKLNTKFDDKSDKDFYLDIYDIAYEDKTIGDIISNNKVALDYYNQNVNTYNTLLDFAMDIYKLYDDIKIDYLDNIDSKSRIEKIQAKKYISIKEFEEIYGKSETSQQGLRGRLKDPIPYRQIVKNGAVTYVVEEIEKWFSNQYK
ncbi:MAG: hypothetical protein KAQ94_09920 [Arcobacteraceae bacterium]|nr:hypothetical protein [Arcobacteraceae bacterium]